MRDDNPFLNLATQNKPVDQAKLGTDTARIAKSDKAPTAQGQTQVTALASLSQLLSKFDVQRIPLSRLRQMRRDPIIAFALYFIQAQLLRSRWSIKCSDPQVAAFVDNALREIWPSLVQIYMNKLTFGYQPTLKRFTLANPDWTYVDTTQQAGSEKPVWDNGSVQATVFKKFVGLPPESAEPLWTPQGEFNGINYKPALVPTSGGSTQGEETNYDILSSLWFTNERESVHGSLYGYPRIGYAYRFWWSFWFNWGLADRHFEKDADPPTVVRYPAGQTLINSEGTEISSRSMALLIGDRARSNSTIAMPSDVVVDDQGNAKSIYEWSIEFLKGGGNFDAFHQRFEQLQIMMLRACMVPEEAFQAKGGTAGYNSTGQLLDKFAESQIGLSMDLDADVNNYVIPQLVAANFADRLVKATKVTKGFDVEDIALAKTIITGVANSDINKLDLDVRSLMDAVGLPSLTPEQIQQRDAQNQAAQQAIAGAAQAQQDKIVGQVKAPGKPDPAAATQAAAGVNKQGLYYAARPSIELSSEFEATHAFMSELANIGALRDPIVMDDALRLRSVWRESLRRDFDEAAALVQDYHEITLDEQFFQRWSRRAAQRAQDAVFQTRRVIASIMRRASTVEFEKVGLTDYSWDPDFSKDATEYIRKRGIALVDDIANTTEKEIKVYLSDLLARGVDKDLLPTLMRAHFEFFADHRADRIVRSEIAKSYNMATIFAANDFGVNQFQAIDGQFGAPRSDAECIDRNGQICSTEEAIKLTEDEHANGTLQWRILPDQTAEKHLPLPELVQRAHS